MRGALLLALVGCLDVPPVGERLESHVERVSWTVPAPRALDVLLVIDNSPAMAPHRARWITNARGLGRVLESLPGGLPSVHVGVVTTDLGTRGRDDVLGPSVTGCRGRGDAGRLRTSAGMLGNYLSDIVLADGTRQRNYVGAFADVLGDLFDAGTEGCGYVQPLEAMSRALASTPANPGFLRADAELLVVFVTSNDDCSFTQGGFAVESAAINAHECVAREAGLVDLDVYETELRARNADSSRIALAVVAGPAQPLSVETGPEGLQRAPSCRDATASALPAQRLVSFASRFPSRATFTSICQDNWIDGLVPLSELLTAPIGNPCFAARVVDLDLSREGLQPECAVSVHVDETELLVPSCERTAALPCWTIREDPARCTTTPNQEIEVRWGATHISTERRVVAECVVGP